MFPTNSLTFESFGSDNHTLYRDGEIIIGEYRRAHGQFLLASRLQRGVGFYLTVSGMGVIKINTFDSFDDAIDWINSGLPMTTGCQRIRSKSHTSITFSALVRDSLQFWPDNPNRVKLNTKSFYLRAEGDQSVLAFDIECGDLQVSVTHVTCPANRSILTTDCVFHPLHAPNVKLVAIPYGSQVCLEQPVRHSLARVNQNILLPGQTLSMEVEGTPKEASTGGYFRLWVLHKPPDSSNNNTLSNTLSDQQRASECYVKKSTRMFLVQPNYFQKYIISVKSDSMQVALMTDPQVNDSIKEDFSQHLRLQCTLWIEFYKVAFAMKKTDLSWDWPSRQEQIIPATPTVAQNSNTLNVLPSMQHSSFGFLAGQRIESDFGASPTENQLSSTSLSPNNSPANNEDDIPNSSGFSCRRGSNHSILSQRLDWSPDDHNANCIPWSSISTQHPHRDGDRSSYLAVLSNPDAINSSGNNSNSLVNNSPVSRDTSRPIPCPGPPIKKNSDKCTATPSRPIKRFLNSFKPQKPSPPASSSSLYQMDNNPNVENTLKKEFDNMGFHEADGYEVAVGSDEATLLKRPLGLHHDRIPGTWRLPSENGKDTFTSDDSRLYAASDEHAFEDHFYEEISSRKSGISSHILNDDQDFDEDSWFESDVSTEIKSSYCL